MKNKTMTLKTLFGAVVGCLCFGCAAAWGGGKEEAKSVEAEETTITETAEGFVMQNGASVKLTGSNGLRFTAELPDSLYKEGYTYGMLIAPAEYVEQYAFTYENVFGGNAVYDWAEGGTYSGTKTRIINITYSYGDLQTRTDDGYLLRGSVVKIKDDNIARSFVGRAYLRDESGNVQFAKYYDEDSANNTRSMYTVATAALADSNSGLTPDQKTTLQTSYIDKMYTEVTYTTTEGYTQFITTQATGSTSSVSTSSADFSGVTLPSGYEKMYKLRAGYGENYQIFKNVDLDAYECLRFAVYPLNVDDNPDNNAWVQAPYIGSLTNGQWTEIELVKQNDEWHIVMLNGEKVKLTDSDLHFGLSLNFALTEVRGIKSADTSVRYHSVTYYDVDGNKLDTEKVKEGAAAKGYTATLPSSTESDGYTHEYTNAQWKTIDGAAATLTNVTTDQKVYLSYEELIWKSANAYDKVGAFPLLASLNKYAVADGNGNITFKIRLNGSTGAAFALYKTQGYSAEDNYFVWLEGTDWYTVTINGATKHIVVTDKNGNIWNGYNADIAWYDPETLSIVLNVDMDIAAITTVKYVPTYTVTYYDENGVKLYTENVKEGNSATYAYAGKTLENGYTEWYTDVAWVTEQGGETVADLSAISGNTNVYLKVSGTHLQSKQHDLSLANKDNNYWVLNTLLKNTDENIVVKNGECVVYFRTSGNMDVGLMDTATWNPTQVTQNANEWYRYVFVFGENGTAESLTVYDGNGTKVVNKDSGLKYTIDNTYLLVRTENVNGTYAETGVIEIATRIPNVYTVTYHGEDGEIVSSERVQEGLAANGYTMTLPSSTTDSEKYTHEYLSVQWQLEDGTAADLSAVNGDMHVYPGFEQAIWKTGKVDKSCPALTVVNEYITADEDGNVTFKIRLSNGGTDAFYLINQGWGAGEGVYIDGNNWYTVEIDGTNKTFTVRNSEGTIHQSKENVAISWYNGLNSVYTDFRADMDVAAITTVKYAPTYTVTYYDGGNKLLHSEKVKEGEASSFTATKDTETDGEGYKHVYADLQWQNADGSVANLSAVNGNMQVYAAFKETIWTTAKKYADGSYPTIASLNKYAVADENGNLTIKLRTNEKDGGSFVLYPQTGWYSGIDDITFSHWMNKGEWYTLSIDKANDMLYLYGGDNKQVKSMDISSWETTTTAFGLVLHCDMDIAAVATAYTKQAITEITEIAVLSKYEGYSGDRRIGTLDDAVIDFKALLKEATGKDYTVTHVDSFNALEEGKRYFILDFGTEAWLTSGLTTDSGYRIAERNGNLYLYGKTAYGTRRAVYALLKQAFGFEFYTDDVYTYEEGAFDFSKITETTFNPSIDYNWASSVAEYKSSTNNSTPEDRAYTNRLNMVYSSWELGGGYHNFLDILPKKTYSSAHPNWYVDVALPDSKTFWGQALSTFTTLNLAYGLSDDDNGAMATAVAEYIYNWIVDDYEVNWTTNRNMFVFGAPDYIGWQTEDTSYQTKYGSNSAEYLLFMNLVAKKLSEMNPTRKTKLVMMAYGSTLEAPNKNTDDLKFYNDGTVSVNVMFAPCSSNLYLSLDDTTTGYTFHDSLGDKYAQYYHKSNAEYKAELEKWSALAEKSETEVLCFYYSAHYDNYFVPLDSLTNMQSKYQTFAANGVTNLYNMGPTGDDVFTDWNALKIYMSSKYAEDADRTDGETLMLNFCKAYYGEKAGQTMYDLWNAEAAQWKIISDNYITAKGGDPTGCHLIRKMLFDTTYWGDNGLATLKGWYAKIQSALDNTTEGSDEYKRIKVEGLNIRYLLIAVYGDTTYGTITEVRADAESLGIDIFAESTGYTSNGDSVTGTIDNLA